MSEIKKDSKKIQRARAIEFKKLHYSDDVLIVPNAWDVISAKIFEIEGFKCMGTTSAGIANALGYPDMEGMSLEDNLSVTKRIVNSLDIPVTADIEACYTNDENILVENVQKILQSGVAGINIEDSPGFNNRVLHDIEFQREKVSIIRDVANKSGSDLFINTRIDAWMFLNIPIKEKIIECLKRAQAYIEAGADSIFVPDLEDMDEESIIQLVAGIDAPLNIIAGKNTPTLSRLKELGVKRVSLGPRPMRAVFSLLRKIATELRTKGTYNLMNNSILSYSEINQWFQ